MSRTLCCLSPKDNPIKLRNLIIDYLTHSHTETCTQVDLRTSLCTHKHTHTCLKNTETGTLIYSPMQRFYRTPRHVDTLCKHTLASPRCPVNVYYCHPPVDIQKLHQSVFSAARMQHSMILQWTKEVEQMITRRICQTGWMCRNSLGTLTTVLLNLVFMLFMHATTLHYNSIW